MIIKSWLFELIALILLAILVISGICVVKKTVSKQTTVLLNQEIRGVDGPNGLEKGVQEGCHSFEWLKSLNPGDIDKMIDAEVKE